MIESEEGWLRGGWILTHTGRQMWPLSPKAAHIDVVDIAHSLGMQCRYNGHVSRFYSVAEHCVLISEAVEPEHALWGLLHDAAEAYIGDMVRPLKKDMPEYCAVDDNITAIIAFKFGLPTLKIPTAVHQADSRILLTERAELLTLNGHRWDEHVESLEPLDVTITGWSPEEAKARWLDRFCELLGTRFLCVHCDRPIRLERYEGAPSVWSHFPDPPDPSQGWQGVRCPNRLTAASPG